MNIYERMRRRVVGHGFGYAIGALLAASWLVAQEPAEDKALPSEVAPGPLALRTAQVTVGMGRVGSLGPWTAEERKAQRAAPLWQLYMHGVIDFFANPVPWEALLGADQAPGQWLDPTALVNTSIRRSTFSALKLSSGDSILLEKPLPLPALKSTDSVRVFVWLTAREANGHDDSELLPTRTPSLEIVARDAEGRTIAAYPGPIRTRGTFGWHCYYMDVPLGAATVAAVAKDGELGGLGAQAPRPARLFVHLRNPTGGTVWFSTLSWELLGAPGTAYMPEDLQDPVTGSLAPFPAMDELVVHLLAGRAYAYAWQFFRGAEGGARNVPGLSTAEGIRNYVIQASKTDKTGSLGGAVFLGPWLYAAKEHPKQLDLPPDWHTHFRTAVTSLQDSKTGFWPSPLSPTSMAATARVVENLWGGAALVRNGFTVPARPWLGYGGEKVPEAKSIVATVLDSRSRRKAGGVDVGAWGALAYEWRNDGETEEEICSLATTRNAFVLLRLASSQLADADRGRVEQALLAAWRSVFRLCVMEDATWKLGSRETEPTLPAFLPRILDLSPWLEERTDKSLPAPNVAGAANMEQKLVFTWTDPVPAVQSVRVFAAPKETAANAVHLAQLVGILEREKATVWTMDPVHAAGCIRDAARSRWGVDIGADAAVPLLADRLAIYDQLKGAVASGGPLTVSLSAAHTMAFYVASVDADGVQSALQPLAVSGIVVPEAKPEVPQEPTELPAGENPFGDDAPAEPAAAPQPEAPAEPAP